ncbi:hypothetical protein BGZ58_007030 [Dissophora ornata]|nr:hypothetical protein BGZ58_007030 [Dissophora ornata]
MPPKRDRTETAISGAKGTSKSKQMPTSSRKRGKVSAVSKRSRRSKVTDDDNDDDDDNDEEDSEKEIETLRDYEDAVRRRILTSTTNRYDDTLEHDQLAFAASLMMSASDLHSSVNHRQKSETSPQQQHPRVVYSLGTFCMHAIVKDFKYLASDVATPPDQIATTPPHRGGVRGSESLYLQLRRRRQQLAMERRRGAGFRRQVQELPFYLSTKLFRFLRHARPELLSTKVWTSLFFPPEHGAAGADAGGRGSDGRNHIGNGYITELDLEGIIPSQVTDATLRGYILHTLNLGPQLERINLNYMSDLPDRTLAQLVGACPNLTRLSLKGCTKVGDLTLANLPGQVLQELNISFVAAPTTKGIKQLVMQCRELKVLKMAGIVNVKDALFLEVEKEVAAELGGGAPSNGSSSTARPLSPPLHALENLKISTTKLGDRGLKVLLRFCGKSLRRLDISATNVTRTAIIAQFCVWEEEEHEALSTSSTLHEAVVEGSCRFKSKAQTHLEKLNLTRLKITSPTDLLALFKRLPLHSLHTLLMGYLSCGQVPIRDNLLDQLCPYLAPEPGLESELELKSTDGSAENSLSTLTTYPDPFAPLLVPMPDIQPEFRLHTLSLFGNPQIGQSKQPYHNLHLLFKRLSPYLRRLELGYTQCRSATLAGLLIPHDSPEFVEWSFEDQVVLADNNVLEELGLDETPMDDESASVLSRFRRLNRLSLANTRMDQEAVERVVEACPALTSLDLTSCRGVPLLHRRTLLKEVRQRQSERA